MKLLKNAGIILSTLAVGTLVVGCSNSDDADSPESGGAQSAEVIETDPSKFAALQEMADATNQQMSGGGQSTDSQYAKVEVDAYEPYILNYRYTLAEQVDPVAKAEELEAAIESDEQKAEVCKETFAHLAEGGFSGPWTIGYEYMNADGSTIVTQVISCP